MKRTGPVSACVLFVFYYCGFSSWNGHTFVRRCLSTTGYDSPSLVIDVGVNALVSGVPL